MKKNFWYNLGALACTGALVTLIRGGEWGAVAVDVVLIGFFCYKAFQQQMKTERAASIEELPPVPPTPPAPTVPAATLQVKAADKAPVLKSERPKERPKAPFTTEVFDLKSIPAAEIVLSDVPIKRRKEGRFIQFDFYEVKPGDKIKDFVTVCIQSDYMTYHRYRIVQIAAIKFRDGKPVEKFYSIVNPEIPYLKDDGPLDVTIEEQQASPTISQLLPSFEAFIDGENVVGDSLNYNLRALYESGSEKIVPGTNIKFIDIENTAKSILRMPKEYFDGKEWSKDFSDYDVENFGVHSLSKYYDISFPHGYRADADALFAGEVFNALIHTIEIRSNQ